MHTVISAVSMAIAARIEARVRGQIANPIELSGVVCGIEWHCNATEIRAELTRRGIVSAPASTLPGIDFFRFTVEKKDP